MPINWLFESPAIFLAWSLAVVFSLTVHEFAHGAMAAFLGDDTAKNAGRLTLNPLAHVDMVGFLMLLFVGFGWAKPVPYDPANLKNERIGSGLVALSGPLANLLVLAVFGLVMKFLAPYFGPNNLLINFLMMLVLVNAVLMVFNLIPIPPLDGSKILFSFLPDKFADFKYRFAVNGPFILLFLVLADSFFNVGVFSRLFSYIFYFLARFF